MFIMGLLHLLFFVPSVIYILCCKHFYLMSLLHSGGHSMPRASKLSLEIFGFNSD